MTCPRSQRQEVGDAALQPGRSGFTVKVLSLHQAMLFPRVPWGLGSPARLRLSGKTDQRNHFLYSITFELGGQGARTFSGGPGSAVKCKQAQCSGGTSNYRDFVSYF